MNISQLKLRSEKFDDDDDDDDDNNNNNLCSFSNCAPVSDILHSYTCINMAFQSYGEAYCTRQGRITLQTYLQGQVLSAVGIAHHLIHEYCLTD